MLCALFDFAQHDQGLQAFAGTVQADLPTISGIACALGAGRTHRECFGATPVSEFGHLDAVIEALGKAGFYLKAKSAR